MKLKVKRKAKKVNGRVWRAKWLHHKPPKARRAIAISKALKAASANAKPSPFNSRNVKVEQLTARLRVNSVAHATVSARAMPAPWRASKANKFRSKANSFHTATATPKAVLSRASKANALTAKAKTATPKASTLILWVWMHLLLRKIMGLWTRRRKSNPSYKRVREVKMSTVRANLMQIIASLSTKQKNSKLLDLRTKRERQPYLAAMTVLDKSHAATNYAIEKLAIWDRNVENASFLEVMAVSAANVKTLRARAASLLVRALMPRTQALKRSKKLKINGVTIKRECRPSKRFRSILCHFLRLIVILTSRPVNTPLTNTAKRPGNIKKKTNHRKQHDSRRIRRRKRISSQCLPWQRTPLLLKRKKNTHSKRIWASCTSSLQGIAHKEEEHYHKTTTWWTCKIPAKSNKLSTEREVNQDHQEGVHKLVHSRLALNFHSILEMVSKLPSNSPLSLRKKNIWRVSPLKWKRTNSGLPTLNNTSIILASSRSLDSSTTKKKANLWKRWCFISSQCQTSKLQRSLWLIRMKTRMAQGSHHRASRVRNNSSSYSWW